MRAAPILCTALLALASCAALGHEALTETARGDWFTVHARDRATAERVLLECQELAPGVLSGPSGGAPKPLEVYCMPVDSTYGEGRNLTTDPPELRHFDSIEIDIGRELSWERFVIAHELAHAWLAPVWHPLPQILEEGLADMAGERADPEVGVCRRMLHGLRLVTWSGNGYTFVYEQGGKREAGTLQLGHVQEGLPDMGRMLELESTSHYEVGGVENENLLYAVGYALVEQIGLARLKELCLRAQSEGRAQVPSEWLLEAAGIERDAGSRWAIRGLRLLGEDEVRMLQRCMSGEGPFRFIRR